MKNNCLCTEVNSKTQHKAVRAFSFKKIIFLEQNSNENYKYKTLLSDNCKA